jgi:hypothetical protein
LGTAGLVNDMMEKLEVLGLKALTGRSEKGRWFRRK